MFKNIRQYEHKSILFLAITELSEFICLEEAEGNFFNRNRTLALIDLYKKYKSKVGTYEMKSMKKLWEFVARDISNLYHITVSSNKCENRFKVLERNYKKTIDNNNKSGCGSKTFEFENEMNEIYNKKCNIRPVILLSSNEVIQKSNLNNSEPMTDDTNKDMPLAETIISIAEESSNTHQPQVASCENQKVNRPSLYTRKRKNNFNSSAYKKRNDILIEMKNDLRSYYDRKLAKEDEKIEISKNKLANREKRTLLLEEQVDLLRQIRESQKNVRQQDLDFLR